MIYWLKLESASMYKFRSSSGSAVRLGFEPPPEFEYAVYGYEPEATVDDVLRWQARVGELFPIRIKWQRLTDLRTLPSVQIAKGLR